MRSDWQPLPLPRLLWLNTGVLGEVRAAGEREAREELAGGRRHLAEARMKEQRRTHGRPGHEAGPQ